MGRAALEHHTPAEGLRARQRRPAGRRRGGRRGGASWRRGGGGRGRGANHHLPVGEARRAHLGCRVDNQGAFQVQRATTHLESADVEPSQHQVARQPRRVAIGRAIRAKADAARAKHGICYIRVATEGQTEPGTIGRGLGRRADGALHLLDSDNGRIVSQIDLIASHALTARQPQVNERRPAGRNAGETGREEQRGSRHGPCVTGNHHRDKGGTGDHQSGAVSHADLQGSTNAVPPATLPLYHTQRGRSGQNAQNGQRNRLLTFCPFCLAALFVTPAREYPSAGAQSPGCPAAAPRRSARHGLMTTP